MNRNTGMNAGQIIGTMNGQQVIGLDIAKLVFQLHSVDMSTGEIMNVQIKRAKVLEHFVNKPKSLIAIEACGGAHHWAREIASLGHEVKLIPPAYVKPFVKRNKNDAVDAEAICEAAQRPSMRYAAIKTEAQQAAGMVFRTRDLLVRQRTQLINAIRGHLTEFGRVAPKGPSHISVLASLLEEGEEVGASLPEAAHAMFLVMTGQLEQLNEQVALLDKEIARRAREEIPRRRVRLRRRGTRRRRGLAGDDPAALEPAENEGTDPLRVAGGVERRLVHEARQVGKIAPIGKEFVARAVDRD